MGEYSNGLSRGSSSLCRFSLYATIISTVKIIGHLLRSLYLWGAVILVTCVVSTLILCSLPLSLIDRDRRWPHWLGTLWAAILVRVNPFWTLRVAGRQRIQKNEGYVLVANHLSLADIVCLFSMGRQFKWLAKRSLFRIPFLGWAMWAMGSIPLERGRHGSIRESYRKALAWLQRDISVLIFPEGTRSRTGEMGHFKSGAFRLALESGRPIVPIVLAGTEEIIQKGQAAFGKVRAASLTILPPIETRGLSPESEEKLRNEVEQTMRREFLKRKRMLARLR